MNNLLIWPLSEHYKIIFSSQSTSLSSITCCDPIDILLYRDTEKYVLASGLTGCKISSLKKELHLLLQDKHTIVQLQGVFTIKGSELETILLELYLNNHTLTFFIITFDDIQSWLSQLELLEILMQENENEQKNRGKGCCG
jgi:hypothetical protein